MDSSASATACPSENELLARAAGKLPSEDAGRLDAHVDVCTNCRLVLAEAAAAIAEPIAEPPPQVTFTVGEIVAERYVVVRWLATGGMGEVYEVHDTWLEENIALKTIATAIADDSRALARLKAELRAARRVTHANVCRVYDLGFCTRKDETIAFLTMELLRGVTLRQRLLTTGPFASAAARTVILQMAEALRHAHAAGIVHRDFKSDNVMLVQEPRADGLRVVVMDFGLARQSLVGLSQPLTPQSRTVFGTLDYMSPEQVMGRPATPSSDIYSLGIVVYELLTGHLPFEGESPLARALARVTGRAPSLGKALPSAPNELVAIVARCLQTESDARFAGVDDLMTALAGKPIPRERARRNASLIVALAAIGVTAMVAIVLGQRKPAEPLARTVVEGPALGIQHRDDLHAIRIDTAPRPAVIPPSTESALAATAVVSADRAAPASARSQKRSRPVPPSQSVTLPAAPNAPSPVADAKDTVHTSEPAPGVRRISPPAAGRDALLDPFAAHTAQPRPIASQSRP